MLRRAVREEPMEGWGGEEEKESVHSSRGRRKVEGGYAGLQEHIRIDGRNLAGRALTIAMSALFRRRKPQTIRIVQRASFIAVTRRAA